MYTEATIRLDGEHIDEDCDYACERIYMEGDTVYLTLLDVAGLRYLFEKVLPGLVVFLGGVALVLLCLDIIRLIVTGDGLFLHL